MDKSLLKEHSVLNDSLPDQMENEVDRMQTSPDRQPAESESGNSPVLNESIIEGRHLQSADGNSESNERQVSREAVVVDSQESEHLPRHSELSVPTVLENNESSFVCKYPGCNYTTLDAEQYFKHEDGHEEVGTVCCDVCNVTFETYAAMRRHQLYVHQGIRTFECQYCSKRFLRKDQFVEHLVKHYNKPRPYQCTFCGETFNVRGHLKTHVSTEHAGIVVGRTCHLCNFKASSPNAIKVHYATFHLKPNVEMQDVNSDRVRDSFVSSLTQNNHAENGAIDLAAVSQNFSYMATHYPSYPLSFGNLMPGPSDLSCRSKVVQRATSPIHTVHNITAHTSEQATAVPLHDDDNRHTCVTSLAGSTVTSPPACQDRACQHVELPVRHSMCIKPEPPELTVDDSQNSNVQPTSTMDLCTSEVVETTSVTNETQVLSDTPCRRKVHKHSSSDDTGSESLHSPSNRLSVDPPTNVRVAAHTCFRYRPYEESSGQRCREFARHTCISHRHNPERRTRFSDSDVDRTVQNDQSDSEERKIFYSRATSTNNPFVPREIHHHPRNNHAATFHGEGSSCTSAPHNSSNYFGRKNIVIRDIESCTLTCTFCGIIFPDQTLYLLHRSLHSEGSPWKCNLCGKICKDKYDFNSHVISKGHY